MLTALPQGREVVGMSETHRDRPWRGEELGFVGRLQRDRKRGRRRWVPPCRKFRYWGKGEEWGHAYQIG